MARLKDLPVITNKRHPIVRLVCVLALLVIILAGTGCIEPKPEPRLPDTEGSVKWAYDVALPRAQTELAADAVLVEISGEDVMPDGRLAANLGKWVLSFSSFSEKRRISITVDHTRAVSVGSRTSPGAIHALGSPPGTFPDSTNIFAATVGKGASGTRTVQNPVACRYDGVAGTHVWLIKFKVDSVKETHQVRWDGIHLGVG